MQTTARAVVEPGASVSQTFENVFITGGSLDAIVPELTSIPTDGCIQLIHQLLLYLSAELITNVFPCKVFNLSVLIASDAFLMCSCI